MKKQLTVATALVILISGFSFSGSALAAAGEPISGVPIGLEGDPGSIAGEPISGVPIGLEHDPGSDTGQIAVTDGKGAFTFTNLAAGNYKLQVMPREGATDPSSNYTSAESTKAVVTTDALGNTKVSVTIKLLTTAEKSPVQPYILTIGADGGKISGTVAHGVAINTTNVPAEPSITSTSPTNFSDVPATYWAFSFITYLKEHGISSGYGNGEFGPERNVTKAEIVKMALISAGIKSVKPDTAPYDDVPLSNSLAIYVATAKSLGFLPNDKTFHPNQPASRFFTLKLLIDMLGKHDEAVGTTGTAAFSDTTTPEQNEYTTYAKTQGIIQGYGDGRYGPDDNVRRSEMAKIIYNSLSTFKKLSPS